jgi:hypothetical protein
VLYVCRVGLNRDGTLPQLPNELLLGDLMLGHVLLRQLADPPGQQAADAHADQPVRKHCPFSKVDQGHPSSLLILATVIQGGINVVSEALERRNCTSDRRHDSSRLLM